MNTLKFIILTCATALVACPEGDTAAPQQQQPNANAKIDPVAHREAVHQALLLREKRRVTEDEFLALAAKWDTVVLDARSESKFQLRHIKGAVNLPFTEFTVESLARIIPTKDTRVLIYCNNNFDGDQVAFAAKRAPAALNLSTFASLVIYGYTNVHELGPVVDVSNTRLALEGSGTSQQQSAPP